MSQNTGTTESRPHDLLNIPASICQKALPDETGGNSWTFCNEDIAVLMITNGSLFLNLDGTSYTLQTGDVTMITPHRCPVLLAAPSAEFYLLLINPSLFQNGFALTNDIYELLSPSSPPSRTLPCGTKEASCAAEQIRRIVELKDQNLIVHRFRLMGNAYLILAEFLTILYQNPRCLPSSLLPESGNLDRMLTYIHLHYPSKIQLSDIADAGNVSRSRCSPIFRKYLHVTPIEYVNNYRLEVSCSYLLNHDLSIAYVANACGFSGQSYYSKLFLRKFGCTPTEYRAQNACRSLKHSQ